MILKTVTFWKGKVVGFAEPATLMTTNYMISNVDVSNSQDKNQSSPLKYA